MAFSSPDRGVWISRLFGIATLLLVIAAIWVPEYRWQFGATALVVGIAGIFHSVSRDEAKEAAREEMPLLSERADDDEPQHRR